MVSRFSDPPPLHIVPKLEDLPFWGELVREWEGEENTNIREDRSETLRRSGEHTQGRYAGIYLCISVSRDPCSLPVIRCTNYPSQNTQLYSSVCNFRHTILFWSRLCFFSRCSRVPVHAFTPNWLLFLFLFFQSCIAVSFSRVQSFTTPRSFSCNTAACFFTFADGLFCCLR